MEGTVFAALQAWRKFVVRFGLSVVGPGRADAAFGAADAVGLNGPARDLAGLITVQEGINPRASRSPVCSITHQGGQTRRFL